MQGGYRFQEPQERVPQNLMYERRPYTLIPADARNVRLDPPPEYVRPQGPIQRDVMPVKSSEMPPNRTVPIQPRMPLPEGRVIHSDEILYKKHYLSPTNSREYIPVLDAPEGRHPIYIDRRRIIDEPPNIQLHEDIVRRPRSQHQQEQGVRYEGNPKQERFVINDNFEGGRIVNRDVYPTFVTENGQRIIATRASHEFDPKPNQSERFIYVKEQDILVRKPLPPDVPKGHQIQEHPSPLELINRLRTLEKLLVSKDKQIEELQFTIHKLVAIDKNVKKPEIRRPLLPKPENKRPFEVVNQKPPENEYALTNRDVVNGINGRPPSKNVPKLDKLETAVNKIKEKKIENFDKQMKIEVGLNNSYPKDIITHETNDIPRDDELFLSKHRPDKPSQPIDLNNNSYIDLSKSKVETKNNFEQKDVAKDSHTNIKTEENNPLIGQLLLDNNGQRDAMHDRLAKDLPRYNWLEERFQPPNERKPLQQEPMAFIKDEKAILDEAPILVKYNLENNEKNDVNARPNSISDIKILEYGSLNKMSKKTEKKKRQKLKRPTSAPPHNIRKYAIAKVELPKRAKSVDVKLLINTPVSANKESSSNKTIIPKLIVSRDESSSYKVTACFDKPPVDQKETKNADKPILNTSKSSAVSNTELEDHKNVFDLLEAKNPIKAAEISSSSQNEIYFKSEKEPFHLFSRQSTDKLGERKVKAKIDMVPVQTEKERDEFLRKNGGVVHHFNLTPTVREQKLSTNSPIRANPPICVVSSVEQRLSGIEPRFMDEGKPHHIWESSVQERRPIEKVFIDPRMKDDRNIVPHSILNRPPNADLSQREKGGVPFSENLRIIRMPSFEDERNYPHGSKPLVIGKTFPVSASTAPRPLQGENTYFLSQKIPRSRNGSLDFEKSKQVEFGFARQSPGPGNRSSIQELSPSKDGPSAFREPRKRPYYDFVSVDPFHAKSLKLPEDVRSQQKFISPELYKKLSEDNVEKPKSRPPHKSPDKRCKLCNMPSQYLCSRCRKAWYCSQECQLQDWNIHSKQCGEDKQLS